MDLRELNMMFGIDGNLVFDEDYDGIVIADIRSDFSHCKVSLYGGHILSFIPVGKQDILMVSSKSAFEKGKPIRGGIPLCFPWFNVHSTQPSLPNHGFARIMDWYVVSSQKSESGKVSLILGLKSNDYTRVMWPFSFYCQLEVSVGKSLDVKWIVQNTGDTLFEVENAFHSYFAVENSSQTYIEGLESNQFIDSTQNGKIEKKEGSSILVNREINRIYLDTIAECKVIDTSLNRVIKVKKSGSRSTIVWNPWNKTSSKISDLGPEDYKRFVCVESGNVRKNLLGILPGQSQETSIVLSTE